MKITPIRFLLASLLVSFTFLGCKKYDDNYFSQEYQDMMRENALLEAAFNDALKVTENVLMNNNDAKIGTAADSLGCTAIDSVVTGPSSKRYTMSFYEACTDYDGKTRIGTIVAELNGANYNTEVGATLTIRLNNYYINGNKVEGKLISTNLGAGTFKVVVSDEEGSDFAKLTFSDGKITRWKSTHKRTIYEGNSDAIMLNNKYKITAIDAETIPFEGVTTDFYDYKGIIKEELVLDYGCLASGNLRYPIDGEVEFTMKENIRGVNYGDGECDYTVTMRTAVYATKSFTLY